MNKKWIMLYVFSAATFLKAENANNVYNNVTLIPKLDINNNIEQQVIYVKKGSNGNGTSWDNAFGELADALKWAHNNKSNFTSNNKLKIYVSVGTYLPKFSARDGIDFNSQPGFEREKSFLLVDNVELYGGFDPENNIKTESDKRIFPNNKEGLPGTILSGDIDENDQIISSPNGSKSIINNENNAYHVIINTGLTASNTILNGFTISGGNANGDTLFISHSFIVSNNQGSAIYSSSVNSSSVSVVNSEILYNNGTSIYSLSSDNSSTVSLTNTILKYNNGTPIYSYSKGETKIKLINSLVSNNIASNNNGIFHSFSTKSNTSVNLINSNIISNTGTSIFNYENTAGNNNLNVYNSIIYNNQSDLYKSISSLEKDYKNSIIQGNTDLSNNNLSSNLDPLFKNAQIGDYSLQDNSPLIDKGNNSLISSNITKDIEGFNRIAGNRIDIGAYERNYILSSDAIQSITLANATNTNSKTVNYIVEFTDNVTGVDINDFLIYKINGNVTGSISSVTGSGKLYTVTINNIHGDGTIRLDIKDNNTGIKNNELVELKGGYQNGETHIVDTVAPDAPSILLEQNSDSGYRSNDRITNITSPTFSGKSEPLSTITIYHNNENTIIDTTITNSEGNWSFTANNLQEGLHKIIVKAKDAANNESESNFVNLTIDTTAPTQSGINIPTDKTYYFDDVLKFNIVYNEEVHITNNGNIELLLSIANIDYPLIGKTTDNKTFSFSIKVNSDMYDDNGILIKGLRSTGTVQDLAGNVRSGSGSGSGTPTRIFIDGRNTDLSIRTNTNKINPKIGEQTTFTINVSNEGKHDAKDTKVNVEIPTGLKIISTNTNKGSYNIQNNTWSIDLSTFAKESTETFTILTEVTESKEFLINANITSNTLDINPSNNSSSVTINSSKKSQAIIWNQELITGCDDSTPLQLQATSSSGLPITYTSSDESVIKIINNQIVIVRLGYAKITAHQAGNNEYLTATSITKDVIQKINGLVQKKFDDTLIFNNSSNVYIKWQWFKNGQKIDGATSQFYNDSSALNGTYHAEVTTTNGLKFETCPLQFGSYRAELGIKSTPNPVKKGNIINIIANYSEAELNKSILIINDVNGRKITETSNVSKETKIHVPNTNGTYIVNLYLSDGRKADTKIIVN